VKNAPIKLTNEQIKAIERTISQGDRVEIVPNKDGAKLLKIKREEVK
jgi:hypothetical protein